MIDDINFDDKTSLNEEVISAREYEEATRTVVRTIGRHAECDVVFAGDGACVGTDKKGQRIVQLPSNPPDKAMTKRQYFIGQGFANHETLHNLCTDIAGCGPRIEGYVKHKQHFTRALANCIEDMRIERAGCEMYPGMSTKLDATAQFASEHYLERPEAERAELVKDFKKIGPLALTWEGRKRMGYKSPAIQQCLDTLPADVLEKVKKYMDVAEKIPTGVTGLGEIDRDVSFKASHHVCDVAEMICAEVMSEPDPETEEEDEEEGGDGTGDGGKAGGKSGKGGRDGGVGAGDSSEFIPVDPDMLTWVAHELEVTRANGGYNVKTTALDVWVKRNDHTEAARHTLRDSTNLRDYHKAFKLMTGKLAVMRRKLERALVAKMDTDYQSGHSTGKLDVRGKGIEIMQRMDNIYRKRVGGKDVSAAVTLLIDASGSMRHNRIELAQQSAIALAEAIARVGVPLEVLVFNTRYPNADEVPHITDLQAAVDTAIAAMKTKPVFARREPITMYEVKEFDDNMNTARMGLGGINKMVASANADGESLLKAWDRLKKRKEENKVLIVLSDGLPSCGSDNEDLLRKHLRDSIKLIEKEGGKCVGIGIQSTCVEGYYSKWAVVNELKDLAGVTIDNVARMLLGERFQVDNSKLINGDANAARKIAVG
jgi:cobalamin biosynthesis protein CobT